MKDCVMNQINLTMQLVILQAYKFIIKVFQ